MAGGWWTAYFASALGGGGFAPRMAGGPRPPRAAPRAWEGEGADGSRTAARTRSAMDHRDDERCGCLDYLREVNEGYANYLRSVLD